MPQPSGKTPRWILFTLIGVGFVLAVVVVIVGVQRSRESERPQPGATGSSGESSESRSDATAQADPGEPPRATPRIPEGWTNPSQPDLTTPTGSPPVSIAGVYMVTFQVRADTCGGGTQPSLHEVEIRVDGGAVSVFDRLSKSTLTGPGGSDGSFVVSYERDQQFGRQREVMTARVEGAHLSGAYYAYPPYANATCVVEFGMDGDRTA